MSILHCTDLDAFNDPQEYQRSEEYYQKWHEARILYGELGRGTQQSMKKINHTAKYTIKPKLTLWLTKEALDSLQK